jgi:hypothetical protein
MYYSQTRSRTSLQICYIIVLSLLCVHGVGDNKQQTNDTKRGFLHMANKKCGSWQCKSTKHMSSGRSVYL